VAAREPEVALPAPPVPPVPVVVERLVSVVAPLPASAPENQPDAPT
jgi:hypothetical protein